MPVIALQHLTKAYGRRRGIEDLSFDIAEGELFGFLGPNGSGKTTTIRVLLGLLRANGEARVFDQDCWKQGPLLRAEVGYLPGDVRLPGWMSACNGLRLLARCRRADLVPTGQELCQRFGLDSHVRFRQMSRGMRQKLGLVLALAHRPRLLILDEPATGLDPLRQQLLHELLSEHVRGGGTVFLSSHTLSEVEDLCDRVAVLREGRLATLERIADMKARARRVVVLDWASPQMAQTTPPPPFLGDLHRDGSQWRATLHGSSTELVQWCKDRPLADLTVGPPDLAALFRSYYASGGRP